MVSSHRPSPVLCVFQFLTALQELSELLDTVDHTDRVRHCKRDVEKSIEVNHGHHFDAVRASATHIDPLLLNRLTAPPPPFRPRTPALNYLCQRRSVALRRTSSRPKFTGS